MTRSRYLAGIALNVGAVRAALPSHRTAIATLKNDHDVTFDPLGVAAVLHNPRASLSAARLYTQYDRNIFIWPHLMMMGATLIPLKVLVEHMTATFQSIHPAISLCTRDTQTLPVVSNMVFKEFPLDFSKMWLADVIAYKSSAKPVNDFMIVCMDELGDDDRQHHGPSKVKIWILCRVLDLIMLLNGAIIGLGAVLGALFVDIWAITLFCFYLIHWATGWLMSVSPRVVPQKMTIKDDSTVRYAIYQRPAGGTVVFKGRQDTMERWARITWEFKRSPHNNILHWLWMITGTFSAIASVACMVNMQGSIQLVFLGQLVYASLAEILATRVARNLGSQTNASNRSCLVPGNKFRTEGITRATIEVDARLRLTGLDWVGLKRMPADQIFIDMQALLKQINDFQERVEAGNATDSELKTVPESHPDVKAAFKAFQDNRTGEEDPGLVQRIQDEAHAALKTWWYNRTKETNGSTRNGRPPV
ncbi:hypothetical protein PISL3812_03568 [Talaromyces islandicus]|uniref:Uncharacterized protein n=1 Tax=Talaromyces islandicus TaxID=28573 RepID=A0A0U1LT36_TALIS|nr:hypothetical protein PISL3812_03568 [Talaromyces islandicus]